MGELGKRYQLVGKLHVPLGAVVKVEGVVVDGPFKGNEGGPNLRIQRVGGRATQSDIQICVKEYFYEWGAKTLFGEVGLPKLENGKTYEMEGYETGGYEGTPGEAYEEANIHLQTTGFYFWEELVVYKAKEIEAVRFQPGDFEGEKALLGGIARSVGNTSYMMGKDWSVIVVTNRAWPSDIEGKEIETLGIYNPSVNPREYTLVDGTWHLVRLQDQLGRKVELRGRARSLNDVWWFHYRGVDLYVENIETLPGWSDDCHWRPMVIRGVLEKARLPSLDQISLKANRDMKEYFIVRKPEWEPLDALLSVERPFTEPE